MNLKKRMSDETFIAKKVYERRHTYHKDDFENFGLKRTEEKVPFKDTEIFLYQNYQLWCKINHATFPKSYHLTRIWDSKQKKQMDSLEIIVEENK